MDLTGVWRADDGGVYYLRQIENTLWWFGEHPNLYWTHVFKGRITEKEIEGEWADLPKGKSAGSGKLKLGVQSGKLVRLFQSGNFEGKEWTRENVLNMLSKAFTPPTDSLTFGFSREADLTGSWIGNDSGFYYVRQIGDQVWWFGEHAKKNWANVFWGTLSDGVLCGDWAELPKGKGTGQGAVELLVDPTARTLKVEKVEGAGLEGTRFCKLVGDYEPGELDCDPTLRPESWSIQWKARARGEKKGVADGAYHCQIRFPYIQNITENTATVLWRVGLPRGINPAEALPTLQAEAWVAPREKSLTSGEKYNRQNGITVSDVAWTYSYEPNVFYDQDQPPGKMLGAGRLGSIFDRPLVQFKVVFQNLKPGQVYHYRIKSDILDPAAGINEPKLKYLTITHDTYFKTAAAEESHFPVRFLAMGDLGPGMGRSSYYYDVFDLFHQVARSFGADLWLELGDLDHNHGGHPNAMDPFFFNVFNAYHDRNFEKPPRWTSSIATKARESSVKAFRKPPYCGLLGGLPVYPTLGNHDICPQFGASLEKWRKAYRGSFEPPGEGSFNQAGQGFFYTFRYGKVTFISLGLPQAKCNFGPETGNWRTEWGNRQRDYLLAYLKSIQARTQALDQWTVVYFHDLNWGYEPHTLEEKAFSKMLAESGVDLVLMAHEHTFAQKTVQHGEYDYRAVVAGTGGYGRVANPCRKPGFVLFQADEDLLMYWRFSTHRTKYDGAPEETDALDPRVKEYCLVKKLGKGKHEVKELELNVAWKQ